ncbi:MAG: hypothetical protein AAFY83_01020 [Pseudomonadota bacterium]
MARLPPPNNRPASVIHRLEYAAARSLFALFRALGLPAASWIAGKGLRFLGPLLRGISRRGEDNLRLIYPHWSTGQVNTTIADVWENLGRTSAEFVHLDRFAPSWDRLEMTARLERLRSEGRITSDQAERLLRYEPAAEGRIHMVVSDDFLVHLAHRQQMIFVTGHFANWEVMSIACDYVDIPCAIIYRTANNPLVDRLIVEQRAKTVRHRQVPKGPEGARAFIDALRDRYSLALLMDQKFTAGVRVPFMGYRAPTAPAAARLALNHGLPLVPVTVERHRGVRFTMRAHDAVTVTPTGAMADDVRTVTTQINDALGEEIKARPGQWLWLHRRWGKNLPPPSTEGVNP